MRLVRELGLALLAAAMLCAYGCGRSESALRDYAMELGSDDEVVWKRAREKLVAAGRRSVNPLIRALKLGNLQTRIRGADTLRMVGEKEGGSLVDAEIERAVKSLIETIAERNPDGSFTIMAKDEQLKLSVVRALGALPSETGVRVLLELLADSNEEIRMAARDSILKAGGRGAQDIMDRRFPKGSPAQKLLSDAIYKLNTNLVKQLTDKNEYDDIRRKAADALHIISGAYIQDPVPLVRFMLDENEVLRQRQIVSELLTQMGPSQIAQIRDSLRKGLEEEDGVIALNSAKALARAGDKSAVDFVVECLMDPNAMVRIGADDALDEVGKLVAEDLITRLNDDDERVRGAIVRVLPDLTTRDKAGPLLVKALDDPDGDVRVAAAVGLGRLAYAPATYALCRALDDRRARVRDYALWALGRIGKKAGPELVETVVKFGHYDYEKLVQVLGKEGLKGFKGLGLNMRLATFEEVMNRQLRARRMSGPLDHVLAVTPMGKMAEIKPILLDAREAKAFMAVVERLTGVSEHKLLGLVGDCVRALREMGFEVKFAGEGKRTGPVPIREPSAAMLLSVLGNLKDALVLKAAVWALETDDLSYQRQGAWVVSQVAKAGNLPPGDRPGIVKRLIELLTSTLPEKNPSSARKSAHLVLRVRVAEALGNIGGDDVKKVLVEALVTQTEDRMRTAVSTALASIEGRKADLLEQYGMALESDDVELRMKAVSLLGTLGNIGAIHLLEKVVRDPKEDLGVRRAAAEALEKMTGRDYSKELPEEKK